MSSTDPRVRKGHIRYGTLGPRACDLHGGVRERFGTLVDPNGHAWLICDLCITSLWEANQPDPNEPPPANPIDAAMDVLKKALQERGH